MRNVSLSLVGLILLLGLPVRGQTFGEITGVVSDPSHAVIAGARITITNVNTNATRTAVSNAEGVYSFPSLLPGTYTMRVEMAGFKTMTRTQVEIEVQQNARIDFELPVGEVTESVEVSGQAALLSTENSTVGTVVENKRIVELPLNGRNYLQLVSLAPNVSFGFPNAGQAGSRQGGERASQNISVAGQRNNYNNFTLDGVDNTDPNFNTFVIRPSIDALQEFKVQTGIYPAEFGREATQINVSTKGGGNEFHGALFHFLRNDKLDAKNYAFTTKRPPKDPFKWNQFGFTLGGPVLIPKLFNGRNKLFFLSNYEWFRQRNQVQSIYNLPSAGMQDGNFNEPAVNGIYDPRTRVQQGNAIVATLFPNNIIPKSRFHPISSKLLEFLPIPNLPNAQLRSNHQQPAGRPVNRDQFLQRIDFVESSNSSWFGRYSWGDENQVNEALKLNGTSVITRVKQWMASNTRVLTPNLVNEARFGYTKFYNTAGTELAFRRNVVDELGIPGLNGGLPVQWGIPNVSLQIYSGFGNDSEGPYENDNNALQFINNTSWIHGTHSFRFGGEIRRDEYNQIGNQFARGQFTFQRNATNNPAAAGTTGDPFADFLLGEVFQAEAAVSIANAKFRSTSFAVYFDDTWKIRHTLTINMGLRYENTPPWEDATGRLFNGIVPHDLSTPNVQDRSLYPYFLRQGEGEPYEGISLRWPEIDVYRDGRLGNRLVGRDNNDFAPRVGITWNPTDQWVIRTGLGLFYSQDTGNPRFDMARNLAGRLRDNSSPQFPNLNWGNSLASIAGGVANVFRPYTFANPYDRRTPRSLQYLFNVQRELPSNTLLEVGYMGSTSHHLESLRAVNEAIPAAPGPGVPSIPDRSPFPTFGRIQLVDNGGNGNYNSLGVKLSKRYSNGITYLVGYTWAKSIDTGSAIRNQGNDTLFPQNSYCRQCERGRSSFDTRHRWVTSALWDMPFGKGRKYSISNSVLRTLAGGWQIGSILTLETGFPYTMASGTDQSNTGAFFDRPDATGQKPDLPRGTQDPQRFFNTAAFVLQPPGKHGNVGRGTLNGPGLINWDFSTLKNFTIKENHQVQFRFESFNFSNHPNWGGPNVNVQSPAFGTITSTRGNMRQLQFGLKYLF